MHNQPHFIGHRRRLKDRLLKDPEQLQEYEILELLLGYGIPRRDTKPLAKDLLARFGSLGDALRARRSELLDQPGFGPGLETFWVLLREIWARMQETPLRERQILDSPDKVAEMARARIGLCECEEFWLAMVDAKNRLLFFERASRGTVDQTAVYPREIMAAALRRNASGIILVHNHPGGDPSPSREDESLTTRLMDSAAGLGLRILDHIIVAENGFYSFQAHGRIL
ncbi:MAG: RadC family protein [Desulfovibrionales bacterium]